MGLQIRKFQRSCLDWIVEHFPGVGLDQRAESFVSIFKEHIPPASRVLDIGGGWGFYAEPLRRLRNCEVTVLDVVEPRFRKVPVITYGGEKIPFEDHSFDVSLLITVLHHAASPEKVLTEAKRVTRHLVIVVEDLYRSSLERIWTILRDTFFTFEFVGHPRNFRTKEEWFRSFQSLGFQVASSQEIYTSILGIRILNGIFVLKS